MKTFFHKPCIFKALTIITAMAGAFLLSFGCAAHDHYAQGQQYARWDRTDAAIAEFQAAVKLEPDNPEYQTSLADAQVAAADIHFRKAVDLLAAARSPDARAELVQALKLAQGHPNATLLLGRLDHEFGSPLPLMVAVPLASAASSPAPISDIALPESKAGTGIGTPPVIQRDMRKMPGARPGGAPLAEPPTTLAPSPEPAPAPSEAPVNVTSQATTEPQFAPGAMSGMLSRDCKIAPAAMETLDEICVHLKHINSHQCCDHPLSVDIEVRVDRISKRYRELRLGTHITGRGHSLRPYQITILAIDPEAQTLSFVVEPIARLPVQ